MMKTRVCVPSDLPSIIRILKSYQFLYGIDMIDSGMRNFHETLLENSFNSSDSVIIAAVDDQDLILGYCLQWFTPNNNWIIRCCYIDFREGETQFNASKIGGKILEAMCVNAESKNCFNFYYVVRDIGRKRLGMTLNATPLVSETYHIDDIEYIPPFTESKHKNTAQYILGRINGKNKKPVIIRHGYLKKS